MDREQHDRACAVLDRLPLAGIHRSTPMGLYHGWPAASNSRLSKLRRSPAHLKAYLEEPPKERSALIIGRAAHTTILEPDTFDSTFTVAELCAATKKGDGQRCSNWGIALHEKQGWLCGVHAKGITSEWSTTRFVLPEPDYRACRLMREAVYKHPAARGLLWGEGDVELSMLWHDRETGVPCKGRMDRLSPRIAGGAIVDVKTTRDAGRREFERAIFAHGYHRQAAFYLDGAAANGIAAEHFVIVAVEKEPPYAVAVYRLTEGAIEGGREQLRPLLARYAECVEQDVWPGYAEDVQDIALPTWAWQQIDEEVTA